MRIVTLGLTLGIVAALSAPAIAAPKAPRPPKTAEGSADSAGGKEEQQKLRDHMRLRDHITKHVKYPATKQELVSACKGMKEVKADDKKWFAETLADRTYDTSDEVVKAVGWDPAPPADTDKTAK
jgi:hypothetical protein